MKPKIIVPNQVIAPMPTVVLKAASAIYPGSQPTKSFASTPNAPSHQNDVRLSPLFDVVTTSIYRCTRYEGAPEMEDRTCGSQTGTPEPTPRRQNCPALAEAYTG